MNPHTQRSCFRWSVLVVLSLLCLGMPALAQPPTGPSNPPGGYNIATWNMQRQTANWGTVIGHVIPQIHAIALQEVPITAMTGAELLGTHPGIAVPNRDRSQAIREYRITLRDGSTRRMFVLSNNLEARTPWGSTPALLGLNTAIVLPEPNRPDPNNPGQMIQHRPQEVYSGSTVPGTRSGLLVWDANTQSYFGSVHSLAGGGSDAPLMVSNMLTTAHLIDPNAHVTVMGDFNREPDIWTARNQVPAGMNIYDSGQATHLNGSNYDYAFSTVNTDVWDRSRVLGLGTSDHFAFMAGRLRAGAENVQPVTIESGLSDLVLDPGPQGNNGTFVTLQPNTGALTQKWFMVRITNNAISDTVFYRFVNGDNMKCLDVYKGGGLLGDCGLPNPLENRPSPNDTARGQEFRLVHLPSAHHSVVRLETLPHVVPTREGNVLTVTGAPDVMDGANVAPHIEDTGDPSQHFYLHSAE